MILLLIWLWVGPSISERLDIGPGLEFVAQPLHNWCVAKLPESTFSPLTSAMVCGKVPPADLAAPFQLSGLYHLLVVSGSHLILLTWPFKRWSRAPKASVLIFVFLLAYTLMCGAEAPIFRALVQWTLLQIPFCRFLRSHSFQLVGLSGILCLSLRPLWIDSPSFWLSWLASLAVQFCRVAGGPFWVSGLLFYLIFLPASLSLGSGHLLSLASQWVLAPIFSAVLFPLSLLCWLFPALSPVMDQLWAGVLLFLNVWNLNADFLFAAFSIQSLQFYVSSLQIGFWLGGIWWLRKKI